MKEFEKWYKKTIDEDFCYEYCADSWKAALEWVLNKCPTNDNPTFANQGQGMDGFSELANYKGMAKKLKEELSGE